MKERLPQFSNVAVTLQRDAQLFSNRAGASIASNQVRRSNGRVRAVTCPDVRCHGIAILYEGLELAAEKHGYVWQRLYKRSEQRLERILRNQLIWFKWATIVVHRDLVFGFGYGRTCQVSKRRFGHRGCQKNIHR